jgi:potassium efflux system protein
MAILGIVVTLGTMLSLLARVTVVTADDASSYHVAIVGPLSGPSAEVGKSIRQGAAFLVDGINKSGGISGSTVVLESYDDRDDPAEAAAMARKIVADGRVLAVIGHWSSAAQQAAAPIYKDAGLPYLATGAGWAEASSVGGAFSMLFDARSEARFLSNYARNVIGHKLMSVIAEESEYGKAMADAFTETFERFGAPPQFRWTFKPGDADSLKKLVESYRLKRDEAGALFLAADEISAPPVIAAFKAAGLRVVWFGPSRLAVNAFTRAFESRVGKGESPGNFTNGLYASSPLLFDTANEAAQNFKVAYGVRFGGEPDWVAAFSHDAVKTIADIARSKQIAGGDGEIAAKRTRLAEALVLTAAPGAAIKGVTGAMAFNESRNANTPVLMGIYNGTTPISALTQLQPIPRGAVSNYIEELRQGRALYVNDRFMYKTNVVYVGMQLTEVSELNLEKETAQLKFSVWFRYRGNFDPQDVLFTNATEPVKMENPVDEANTGDMIYRLYEVKGHFNLNFSGAPRSYGSHIVGITFRHRTLNRNNLLYVVDVLGMPSGEGLKQRMVKDKVVGSGLGWEVDRAWVSQEVAEEDALGSPKYVGYGSISPDYSKIDLGVVIKKATLSPRDFVPAEWFIYIAIFAAVASIIASVMDSKRQGRFWHMHSYGMRLVAWPLLLLAGGNLALDHAYQNLPLAQVYLAVTLYDGLWWAVPARLLVMAISRFAWIPLEERTGRKIPNVVRMFVAFIVYALAFLGIIAFVLEQPITSVLAGSGLLAMIVGLAIQANISNIFSGIVLNMERPFGVGDWVKIGSAEDARVTDITWRTTRMQTRSGMTIAIPNAKASESQIVNYSVQGRARMTIHLYVDPALPSETVRKALWDAPLNVHGVMSEPAPAVYFDGIVSGEGGWLAQYSVQYWIQDYAGKTSVTGRVWDAVYSRLKEAGISLGTSLATRSASILKELDDDESPVSLEDKPEWEVVQDEFKARI